MKCDKEIRSPTIGELLTCQSEPTYIHDKYVVKVVKHDTIVRRVSREMSKYCSTLLKSNGRMRAIVSGKRERMGEETDWKSRVITF